MHEIWYPGRVHVTLYYSILIEIENGKYHTTIFDKRDNFGFIIVNFPYLCSNIPTKPAYGVYISQLRLQDTQS